MDKEHLAILRLQEASQLSLAYYCAPLLLCDSGGKDSSVLKQLAFNAKIPFQVLHNHTTADAPETVYFIRSEFARLENRGVRCTLGKPVYKNQRVTMWSLIPQKRMPPTRRVRYCCAILKERAAQIVLSPPGYAGMRVQRGKRVGAFMRKAAQRWKAESS